MLLNCICIATRSGEYKIGSPAVSKPDCNIMALHMQIPTGTTEMKRTTVPFMYNLDEYVEGLDVVDFPGVDDEDDTIGDLADLLLTIAQIIIFVVDYRSVCD